MKQRKIRAIFFDAGNTLMFLDYKFVAEHISAAGVAASADDVRRAEFGSRRAVDDYMARNPVSDGNAVWWIYFSTLFRGVGLTEEAAMRASLERIREKDKQYSLWSYTPAESGETLALLKADGYKIGIISNADGRLARVLEDTGLTAHLDFALDSAVVGFEKPDPRIFRLALERAGEPPEACVHVGDIVAADVVGARSVGIRPVLIDPAGMDEPPCDSIRELPEIIELIRRWNT
jgi:REG-2-like HAD superfamily hydrolase